MTKKTSLSTYRRRREESHSAKFEQRLDDLIGNTDSPPDVSALSDLSNPDAGHLRNRWAGIERERRAELVRAMIQNAEDDITKDYNRALLVALDDPQPSVRLQAVHGLSGSEDPQVLDAIVASIEADTSADVRVAMARLLGGFALKAEYGDLDGDRAERLRDVLLRISGTDPDLNVRLVVIEALAYFSDEEMVQDLIQRAFESGHHGAQVSAVRSMGRQADPQWTEYVTRTMESDESELRYEAARAAGLIGTHRVVPMLIDRTGDEDAEVQLTAISSLGEIGGDMAVQALRNLAQSDSPAVADAAEAALDAAVLIDHPVGPPRVL